MGARLAPPARATLAGPARAREPRGAARLRRGLLSVSRQHARGRRAQPGLLRHVRVRQRLPRAPARERAREPGPFALERTARLRAGHRTLPRRLLLSPTRPHARADGRGRDPGRRRRVGRRDENARRRPRHSLRAGLREQGRDDGLQQSPPARPGVGHEPGPGDPRAQAREPARVARAARQRPRGRLPRGGAPARRAHRVPQRGLGGARAVLGGLAVRADAGADAARAGPARARRRPSARCSPT